MILFHNFYGRYFNNQSTVMRGYYSNCMVRPSVRAISYYRSLWSSRAQTKLRQCRRYRILCVKSLYERALFFWPFLSKSLPIGCLWVDRVCSEFDPICFIVLIKRENKEGQNIVILMYF